MKINVGTARIPDGVGGWRLIPALKAEDAPQIDDDHATTTNPWSGSKTNTELSGLDSRLDAVENEISGVSTLMGSGVYS